MLLPTQEKELGVEITFSDLKEMIEVRRYTYMNIFGTANRFLAVKKIHDYRHKTQNLVQKRHDVVWNLIPKPIFLSNLGKKIVAPS